MPDALYYITELNCLWLHHASTKRIRFQTSKAAAYMHAPFIRAISRTSVASFSSSCTTFACSTKLGRGLGTGSANQSTYTALQVNITLNFAAFSPFVMFISMSISMSDDGEWMRELPYCNRDGRETILYSNANSMQQKRSLFGNDVTSGDVCVCVS